MKVVLILVDGMRPDALCGIPQVEKMKEKASYSLNARTVFPSVTLPCHMSLFHSVDPTRHGTTTNIYMPQVRPINGLCDILRANGKNCATFYSWEQLRDISRPDSLIYSEFVSGRAFNYEFANAKLTDDAIELVKAQNVDFTFLYLGWPDAAGHGCGWMSDEYMRSIRGSWECIDKMVGSLSEEEYTVIVTADHGGHDRTHGTTLDEDMTIPVFFKGKAFEEGRELDGVNIMDIAPTVAKMLGVNADEEWEGKCLI